MEVWDAIILAGGSGKRFCAEQSQKPKQFLQVHFRPILIHTIERLASNIDFRQLIVAVPPKWVPYTEELLEEYLSNYSTPIKVISGGDRRQDSAYEAIQTIAKSSELQPTRVIIHDACRPALSPEFIERITLSLKDRAYGAWVPVIGVVDTLKRVKNRQVVESLPREQIFRVQTPQVFEFSLIRSLSERARQQTKEFTDDASICEYFGIPVGTFEGDPKNLKLTYDHEVEILRPLLTPFSREARCESASDTTSTV